MLVPARQFDHLGNLGLSHLKSIDAAHADSATVDMQHDLDGLLARLGEEAFQDVHHELHRGVVVVEQQDLVERRLLGLGARLGDKPGARPTLRAAVPSIVGKDRVLAPPSPHLNDWLARQITLPVSAPPALAPAERPYDYASCPNIGYESRRKSGSFKSAQKKAPG